MVAGEDKDPPEFSAHSQEHKELADECAVEFIGGDERILFVLPLLNPLSGRTSVKDVSDAHDSLFLWSLKAGGFLLSNLTSILSLCPPKLLF